jgi:hypothetical protein
MEAGTITASLHERTHADVPFANSMSGVTAAAVEIPRKERVAQVQMLVGDAVAGSGGEGSHKLKAKN